MSLVVQVMCDHPDCGNTITSDYDKVDPARWGWGHADGHDYCHLHVAEAKA